MTKQSFRVINILVSLVLVFPWASQPIIHIQSQPSPGESTGLYRAKMILRNDSARARLDQIGVRIIDEGKDWALVIVTEDQLETLARLSFKPHEIDELGILVDAHSTGRTGLFESMES